MIDRFSENEWLKVSGYCDGPRARATTVPIPARRRLRDRRSNVAGSSRPPSRPGTIAASSIDRLTV
ncbi:MAG: hypothetical protein NTNFB02_16280 [Nitrospira sp.]